MRKQERNELVEKLIRLRDEFRKEGEWETCDLLADACNELEKMPESAEPNSCEYWDSESYFCTLRRPQAEPIVRCRDCVDWVRNYTDRAKGRGKRMTLNGAIKQLHELRSEEDMPVYYRLAIAEVINVLLMDAQEVRHGRWEVVDETEPRRYGCSNCKRLSWSETNYCPNCGAKMDLKEENE